MTIAPLRIVKKQANNGSPPQLPQPIGTMLQDLVLNEQKTEDSIIHEPIYCCVIHSFSIEQSDATYLKMEQDQIIYVHFQHFSGWGDGTLIETNTRGWFPLKYTEPYILIAVRPVVTASHGLYTLFLACKTEEYITGVTGLISGVRELLIRTNTLTYDSLVINNNPSACHKRKLLLSGLNRLISFTKNISEESSMHSMNKDISKELVFQLDRIVLWSKQLAHIIGPEKRAYNESISLPTPTLTKGFSNDVYTHHKVPSSESSIVSLEDQMNNLYNVSLNAPQSSNSSFYSQTYYNPASAFHNLITINDEFLSGLASLIGRLHLHSHTSSQLLNTIKQCIYAAQKLISVIEQISTKHPNTQLYIAKEAFNSKTISFIAIAKKVIATHYSTSNDSNEESIIDESESKQLIDSAASCVHDAGQCVTKAKFILRTTGDFNIPMFFSKQKNNMQLLPISAFSFKNSQISHENKLRQGTCKPHNIFPTSQSQKPILNILNKHQNEHLPSYSEMSCQESINHESHSYISNDTELDIRQEPGKCFRENSALPHLLSTKLSPILSHSYPSALECNEKTASDNKLKILQDFPSGTASSFASSERFSITSSYTEHISSPATSPEPIELDNTSKEKEKNSKHILFNQEGQVIGASLYALVERMTLHDAAPDAIFSCTFYLTFRLFTTPRDLAIALVERFPINKPINADCDWDQYYARPVRLRVYNVFKTWIEGYWQKDSDEDALDIIKDFISQCLIKYLPQVSTRLEELISKVLSKTASNGHFSNISKRLYNSSNRSLCSDFSMPPAIISKNLLTQLRTTSLNDNPDAFSITDFDPLEIARQLTLKESKLFCLIMPEELIKLKTSRKTDAYTTVKAMAALSTDIAGWVAESILSQNDIKKRAHVLKQWIKIGNKCLELNNYNTLMAILSALNLSTISRLKKTWNTLSTKSKNIFENFRSIMDYSRNYSIYRSRLKEHIPPCLPFLGLILTDITFIEEGNPSYRPFRGSSAVKHSIQLINYDKYIKIYSIISKLQHFQEPYKLEFVEGLQTWIELQISRIRTKGHNNVAELWRRSLALEPKTHSQSSQQNDQIKNDTGSDIFITEKMYQNSDARKSYYNINFLTIGQ
ncbi:hypothetical protein T552_01083 [Pneumocystis carinii B80]|uniref:Ras-GEF domain-containing protein n=1 Tax=Pneumocystis carinii (strain B80) TaxID=1408658 RepID=A0A0W4ZNE8_PNEC8|nr:hypothetical protein T552_01083 [Pneumocystis carinii B80]KTW29879.1 hypothetical protein T552_01083 [Pneumocystis carinii B80]